MSRQIPGHGYRSRTDPWKRYSWRNRFWRGPVFCFISENKDFTLKAQQKEAVKHVWDGKDMFVLLPTGFGKSIIYEVLPFLFDHKLGSVHGKTKSLVIIASPLVSLMADKSQVFVTEEWRQLLCPQSVPVWWIFLPPREISTHVALILFGSPEALISSKWREHIDTPTVADRIVAVVIDEAHCVSKW